MTTVVERPMPTQKVAENACFSRERLDGDSESLVLECDCRAPLVMGSYAVARLLWHDSFECGACGEGFMITGIASHRSYSWAEDYLGQLEGKEAREEYYARL